MYQPFPLAYPISVLSANSIFSVKIPAVRTPDLADKSIRAGVVAAVIPQFQRLIMPDISVNCVKIYRACFLNDDLGDSVFEEFFVEFRYIKHLAENIPNFRICIVDTVTGLRTCCLAPASPKQMLILCLTDRSAISPSAHSAEDHAVKQMLWALLFGCRLWQFDWFRRMFPCQLFPTCQCEMNIPGRADAHFNNAVLIILADCIHASVHKLFLSEIHACAGHTCFLFAAADPMCIGAPIFVLLFARINISANLTANFPCEEVDRIQHRCPALHFRLHLRIGLAVKNRLVTISEQILR